MAGWITFLLGRPGNEFSFEVNPEAMDIDPQNVEVLQRNLAGDLKQSVMKVNAPQIKIKSSFLSKTQRDQFASLAGVADTFLSFQTRDDWTVINELVSVIDVQHVKLANSSATRLSAALVQLGLPSVITVQTPFYSSNPGTPFGLGPFGGGPFGGAGGSPGPFDPGAVTYDDATRIITMTNPLASTDISLYVSYKYTGWLVKMKGFPHKAQGGWIDRFTYDVLLEGA